MIRKLVTMVLVLLAISPSVVATSPVQVQAASCIAPHKLAAQKGWTAIKWVDLKYGGLMVTVPKQGFLPAGWEAVGDGKQIKATASIQAINTGTWTIYAPYSCRKSLGIPYTQATVPILPQQPSQGSGTSAAPQATTSGPKCQDQTNPLDLAIKLGWKPLRWEDDTRYNGLEVELQFGSSLPPGWAADGGEKNRHIGPDDQWRGMESGHWTFYAPFACQAQVERKPIPDCSVNPLNLALSMKWKPIAWEPDTRYNGLEVELSYGSTLPANWSADGGEHNRHIGPNDQWRGMESGHWTIYAPQPCQATVVRKPISQTSTSSPPPPPAPPATEICKLGKDLADDMKWSLANNQPPDVTDYGGAVVKKAPGNLPTGWTEICSSDGSTCSIYPPAGPCRDKLHVKH